MRFRCSSVLLAAAAVVCFAAIAEAQPGRPGGRQRRPSFGGPGGFGGMSLLMLARNEAVQKEIEIVDDQKAQIEKLVEQMRGQRGQRGGDRPNFREMSEEQRQKFFQEMRERREKQVEEANEKLKKILLKPQVERLEEIRIQLMGLGALNDPEVAKKLKITEAQQEKMQEARESMRESMRTEMRELFRSGDRDKIREKMAGLRKKVEEKVLAVLDSGQKAQFEKIKGEPFEMPEGGLFGRRAPGGRRPGDAQDRRPRGGPRGERGRRRPPAERD